MAFENYDLENIITPVNADRFRELLIEANYNPEKTDFLYRGFKYGFSLEYEGEKYVKKTAPNLKIRIGSKMEIWNKIMTEVEAKRYAGPFKNIPFEYFIQSPIGLVPKDGGKKTRLIFHLSYPRTGGSVNAGISKDKCSVKYPDFSEAVKLCLLAGKNCFGAKSDMAREFRNVPLNSDSWNFLILKAEHPVTGETWFFVDKCLPFGASISCAIFQAISDGIAFLVKFRTSYPLINYLDDFFFAALLKQWCDYQVRMFLHICQEIQFPVALEKTYWGTNLLTFLGLLLDTTNQLICIPVEKLEKALNLVNYFLTKKSKKVTVREVQKLTGVLNFLCNCVVPGRAFLRRLYSSVSSSLPAHYHVRISEENRLDLAIWKQFLLFPNVFSRPFMDLNTVTAEELDMYSDASGSFRKGFGALCENEFTFSQWDYDFMLLAQPSIEYLELFGVTVAVLIWLKNFQNMRIVLFCDNESVVRMINNSSSKCKNCMVLIRLITLESMVRNTRIYAKWVSTRNNGKSDALSRLQFKRFRSLAPYMSEHPVQIPEVLWPMSKLWLR